MQAKQPMLATIAHQGSALMSPSGCRLSAAGEQDKYR
jgi:hypothetical protein